MNNFKAFKINCQVANKNWIPQEFKIHNLMHNLIIVNKILNSLDNSKQ